MNGIVRWSFIYNKHNYKNRRQGKLQSNKRDLIDLP